MATARVIRTGTTQTVELPEGVRLNGEIVEEAVGGKTPSMSSSETNWEKLLDAIVELGELIGEVPDDPPPEDRPGLFDLFQDD